MDMLIDGLQHVKFELSESGSTLQAQPSETKLYRRGSSRVPGWGLSPARALVLWVRYSIACGGAGLLRKPAPTGDRRRRLANRTLFGRMIATGTTNSDGGVKSRDEGTPRVFVVDWLDGVLRRARSDAVVRPPGCMLVGVQGSSKSNMFGSHNHNRCNNRNDSRVNSTGNLWNTGNSPSLFPPPLPSSPSLQAATRGFRAGPDPDRASNSFHMRPTRRGAACGWPGGSGSSQSPRHRRRRPS